jgi:hypothetical protein
MTFPVFASGDVLNASDMNAVGLWLVKTQTIGSAVSSVQVTSAFSTDYDSYRIIIDGGVASTTSSLTMTLGASATGYYWALSGTTYGGANSAAAGSNAASFGVAGYATTDKIQMMMDVHNPFLAKVTNVSTTYGQHATGGQSIAYGGFHNSSVSYTSFTIAPGAGTLTGGTIRVYGYRQ